MVKNSEPTFYQCSKKIKMANTTYKFGIDGQTAPELKVPLWIDGNGHDTAPVKLSDFEENFKVIYAFQSWCPGCHSRGLPALKKMVDALSGNDKVTFLAVQTVFEGADANTFEKIKETQKHYKLSIPFGHDTGDTSTDNISSIMYDYKTRGTPWFILIDQNNKVVFNDFHLNEDKAIEYLKSIN